MFHSYSLLQTAIAIGVASTVLAIPLPPAPGAMNVPGLPGFQGVNSFSTRDEPEVRGLKNEAVYSRRDHYHGGDPFAVDVEFSEQQLRRYSENDLDVEAESSPHYDGEELTHHGVSRSYLFWFHRFYPVNTLSSFPCHHDDASVVSAGFVNVEESEHMDLRRTVASCAPSGGSPASSIPDYSRLYPRQSGMNVNPPINGVISKIPSSSSLRNSDPKASFISLNPNEDEGPVYRSLSPEEKAEYGSKWRPIRKESQKEWERIDCSWTRYLKETSTGKRLNTESQKFQAFVKEALLRHKRYPQRDTPGTGVPLSPPGGDTPSYYRRSGNFGPFGADLD
ncbi:hypothetical protein EV368DRAFT_80491 [Lentinula lateritia]|uniref:Uncharacterized protein n=1 Tax=Lentinula aff. lateritia TaxID=2804960 RepID=A0ACC1U5N3_9AGAR|nr:hypothetical protein F5876DRAFT_75372 [Lentinula aff. lateritia]KAJ3854570.1 hypothetical protein EV368DRAFT_80491 [Lentinula lateritia]